MIWNIQRIWKTPGQVSCHAKKKCTYIVYVYVSRSWKRKFFSWILCNKLFSLLIIFLPPNGSLYNIAQRLWMGQFYWKHIRLQLGYFSSTLEYCKYIIFSKKSTPIIFYNLFAPVQEKYCLSFWKRAKIMFSTTFLHWCHTNLIISEQDSNFDSFFHRQEWAIKARVLKCVWDVQKC